MLLNKIVLIVVVSVLLGCTTSGVKHGIDRRVTKNFPDGSVIVENTLIEFPKDFSGGFDFISSTNGCTIELIESTKQTEIEQINSHNHDMKLLFSGISILLLISSVLFYTNNK